MSKYSKEFKQDALRQSEREGVREASEKLGIQLKVLYTWRREERLERGESPKGLRPRETAEQGLKRLEREVEELREANYIFKKRWVLWWVGNKESHGKYTHGRRKLVNIWMILTNFSRDWQKRS